MKKGTGGSQAPVERTVNGVGVFIHPSKAAAGEAAGRKAEQTLEHIIARQGAARMIIGAANSQLEIIATLARSRTVDWSRVTLFHMDEYVGLPPDHPASFRRWVREHLADLVPLAAVHYLQGEADDPDQEARRYGQLISEQPVDLVLLGFGENGHIAFNDPHVADFDDPLVAKVVDLDRPCREQQVGEGHFPSLAEVPTHAITLTCPGLFSGREWIATVPESRKAQAVRCALLGPIGETCPGSLVRRHPNVSVFLDVESAALLPGQGQ